MTPFALSPSTSRCALRSGRTGSLDSLPTSVIISSYPVRLRAARYAQDEREVSTACQRVSSFPATPFDFALRATLRTNGSLDSLPTSVIISSYPVRLRAARYDQDEREVSTACQRVSSFPATPFDFALRATLRTNGSFDSLPTGVIISSYPVRPERRLRSNRSRRTFAHAFMQMQSAGQSLDFAPIVTHQCFLLLAAPSFDSQFHRQRFLAARKVLSENELDRLSCCRVGAGSSAFMLCEALLQ